MESFSPLPAAVVGALIGLATTTLWLRNERMVGLSAFLVALFIGSHIASVVLGRGDRRSLAGV